MPDETPVPATTGGMTLHQPPSAERVRSECPALFYHMVPPSSVAAKHMEFVRVRYLMVAEVLLTLCPPGRSRSLALTELESSCMRAIQSLALTGELVDPRLPPEGEPQEGHHAHAPEP